MFWFVNSVWSKKLHSSTFSPQSFFKVLRQTQELKYTFQRICWIQIKIYLQTYIGPKLGACYPINKVNVHTLSLIFGLNKYFGYFASFFIWPLKSEYGLKHLLRQNIAHITPIPKSFLLTMSSTGSTEMKSIIPLPLAGLSGKHYNTTKCKIGILLTGLWGGGSKPTLYCITGVTFSPHRELWCIVSS